MDYDTFDKTFDVEWYSDIEDEDFDGEPIIRPHQSIAVPNANEMKKKVFELHLTDAEFLEFTEDFEMTFGGGLSAKFTRIPEE